MVSLCRPMYENGSLKQVTGGPLRPGGLQLSERFLGLCDLKPGEFVLDAGCGEGATLDFLQERFFVKTLGIDRSGFLLSSARQKGAKLPLARALGRALPLAAGQVDLILSECSFSAMGKFELLLEEYRRVLKPGGRLALSDIYARNPQGAAYMRSLPFCSGLRNILSKDELFLLLEDFGFKPCVWEDHSGELKRLSAQMSASHGSLSAFWACSEPQVAPLDVILALGRAKPGYYLLITRKV